MFIIYLLEQEAEEIESLDWFDPSVATTLLAKLNL